MTCLKVNFTFMTQGTPYICMYVCMCVCVCVYIYSGTNYSDWHFCDFPLSIQDEPVAQLFLFEMTRKLFSTAKFPLMFLNLFLQCHIYCCIAASVMSVNFHAYQLHVICIIFPWMFSAWNWWICCLIEAQYLVTAVGLVVTCHCRFQTGQWLLLV